MKKCAVISLHANNEFKKKLIRGLISTFKSKNIDVILISSDHIENFDGVSNYITAKSVSESRYLAQDTVGWFSIDGKYIFERFEKNNSFTYATYFMRLYHISVQYAKSLGYDFMYYIDYDHIVSEKHYDICFSDILDKDSAYFYKWIYPNAYCTLFFYGSTHVLAEVFSHQNLKKLEEYCKTNIVSTVEYSAYHLIEFAKNIGCKVIIQNFEIKDIFHKANIISEANVADIFYHEKENAYYFLMAKGDPFDSIFSAQIYTNNNLIFNQRLSNYLCWHFLKLENNTNYTILYYIGEDINNDSLNKVNHIYTDAKNICTTNRMTIKA